VRPRPDAVRRFRAATPGGRDVHGRGHDEPVTCIGRAVGWPDQNYFARRFKAHHGLSATTYRKRFATEAIHMDDRRLDA
jgi:AraC-like DNA-binding protein